LTTKLNPKLREMKRILEVSIVPEGDSVEHKHEHGTVSIVRQGETER
jgi:hypothetical protein